MKMEEVVDHVIAKIEKARLYKKPFPHMSINGIFPEDFYNKMISQFPTSAASYMVPLSAVYNNRFVMDLDDDKPKGSSNFRRHIKKPKLKKELELWVRFRKFIMSKRLQQCLLEKYADYLDPKLGKLAYPTGRLSVDMKGYSIGAHRDRDDKLVSVMFYCPTIEPSKQLQEDAGTVLLVPKDPSMKTTSEHYSFDLFDVVKTAKYRPNSLFSWPVLENSFHGVLPMMHDVERTTIGYFIKAKNAPSRF